MPSTITAPRPRLALGQARTARRVLAFSDWCSPLATRLMYEAFTPNRFYIPEWLLKAWQMQVDPDLSSAA